MLTILSETLLLIDRQKTVKPNPDEWVDRFRPMQLTEECPAGRPFNPLRDLRW